MFGLSREREKELKGHEDEGGECLGYDGGILLLLGGLGGEACQ